MSWFLALSYAGVSALIVVEGLILQRSLQETAWVEQFYFASGSEAPNEEQLAENSKLPEFSGPVLGTTELLGTFDLIGNPGVLIFISSDEPSASYKSLAIVIHSLWHRMEGRIYLVCRGTEQSCHDLIRKNEGLGVKNTRVQVVLDEGGQITGNFGITTTPRTVEFDSDARIRRYGRPERVP